MLPTAPPHRSVREALPHTAPPSGQTIAAMPLLVVAVGSQMECLIRLSVRSSSNTTALPFGDLLSSTRSATGVPALFPRVDGTMDSSEFLLAFMSDFPSETFSDRSTDTFAHDAGMRMEANRTSRFSRLRCPRMHRVTDSAVSAVALPKRQLRCGLLQVRTRSAHGSGDFGAQWLACVTLHTNA